jgi:hypothetical protein
MRIALASLILTAAVASAAQAQTPAASAPAPSTQPAPAAPSTTAAPPTTAAPTTTPPTTAAPTTAAPDTTVPPVEAAPTLPTSGDGAVLLNIVEKVCVPLVRGGKLEDLAKANGFKLNRRDATWTMPLGGDKAYTVTMFPVGVNKDACRGEVHYALGGEKPIVSAFNVWSFVHQPELILQANYVNTDADGVKRVRKSWEHLDSTSSTAINFSTMTKPDDSPLNKNFATAEFVYQERHLSQ